MKELLILSGKGGTGKTTITSSFIKLSSAKTYADCDVDAPNLHLIMKQSSKPECKNYYGMPKANIDNNICIKCNKCIDNCRFDAIENLYKVNPFACEGCGVCEMVCPLNAIVLSPAIAGDLILYNDEIVFSTAKLKMGNGTSGKLVSEVKKDMKNAANSDFAIIDGSPGIGCPIIASLSGVHMVLIVAEPSISGISDMKRIIKTANIFNVKIGVCVNKYDLNIVNSQNIEDFCEINKLPFVGKIPFDLNVMKSVNRGLTIVDVDSKAKDALVEIYSNTMKLFFEKI